LRDIILSLRKKDKIENNSEDRSTPKTPGTPGTPGEEDEYYEANEEIQNETPTSELLRKCRIARQESTMAKRERLKACFTVFDEKDVLLFKERCKMQNVKDVAYTVSRLLRKLDEKYPNKFDLTNEEKQNLNSILAELISIQDRDLKVKLPHQ